MNAYVPSIIESLKYNGSYYAFPFYATSALTIYNSSLFNKAGLTSIPKTYNDMYSGAKAVKDKTGAFVTMPTLTENDTVLKILNKNNINSPNLLLSARSQEIFNQFKYLYENNLIPKESITQNHREALEKYMAGQLVYLSAGANFLNIIKENAPEVYNNTGVAAQLVGDSGKYDFSLMNLIIPKRSKNSKEAVKFAVFLTNKQNQLELAKLASILPVNQQALQDNYFKNNIKNDNFSKARIIASLQLYNVQPQFPQNKNQKDLLTQTNNYTQMIVLNKKPTKDLLRELSEIWRKLINTD